MLNWLATFLVRRAYRATNQGDIEGAMRMIAEDVRLVFPGSSGWAGEYRGRAAFEGFVRKVIAHGLQHEVHDVLTKGPLWDMTLVLVVSDHARDERGEIVYANKAVEYCKLRWGKIRFMEVYEDTEKSLAWDQLSGGTTPGSRALASA